MNTTRNFSSIQKYIALLIYCIPLFSSCNDDWNSHYDKDRSGLPNENLYDLIKADNSLSRFKQLIDISGYKELFSSSQTFTVWAPENKALESIDITDTILVRLTVSNHIARFNYSTSTPAEKAIRMISGKIYHFSGNGDTSFGDCLLISKDKLAQNGVLHTIDRPIIYTYNIYEYISARPEASKLFDFINNWKKEHILEDGYDTVITSYNLLFQDKRYGLGSILSEDSAYTVLVPTNAAYDAIFTRISAYFNAYDKKPEVADSIKKVQTSLAILNDLIYRGKIINQEQSGAIISTSGSVIHDANDLFRGATIFNASNGLIYLTDNLRYNNVETWNKEIQVECENPLGRITGENTNIWTRVVDGNSVIKDVSGNRYIDVEPKNSATQPSATFDIPDVLSGKYNIYAEFIPAIIEGENAKIDSTKLNFTLKYPAQDGSVKSAASNNHVTGGREKLKVMIFEAFAFPVSDYHDRLWLMDPANNITDVASNIKLEIKTNVSSIEFNTGKYARKFRVDRIVFEPIQN